MNQPITNRHGADPPGPNVLRAGGGQLHGGSLLVDAPGRRLVVHDEDGEPIGRVYQVSEVCDEILAQMKRGSK